MKSRFGFGPVFALGRLWLPLACAVALVLGIVRLGNPGLWIDEITTARWAALPWRDLLDTLRSHTHAPLYFVLERLVAGGGGEVNLRLFSLLAGVGAVALSFWAFRPMLNERAAAATAWFLALSPQFFLYSRMARYYALMTLLAMLAHGLFVRLALGRGRPRSWPLYGLAAALMLSASYVTVCLLLAHGVWAAVARRRRGLWKPWLAAAAGALLVLSPWLLALRLAPDATRNLAAAPTSRPAEWLLILGYDFHALTATELLYPWEPLGVLGLLCGGWLLFMGGLAAVRRGLGRSVLLPAVAALGLAWIVVAALARETPFVGLPSRTLYLWPFAAVLMALGALDSAQPRSLRWAATTGILLAWLGGWANLYRPDHYLNPIYLTPGREVARDLVREAGAADAVLSEDDAGATFYLDRLGIRVPVTDPVDPAAVRDLLASPGVRRVWWVRLSRDGTQWARPAGATGEMLAAWGTCEVARGYLEIDPRYQAIKRAALKIPGYQYRIVLERWRRRG
jgi:4-amino-4-deoxy-L-arabinose transferase-like glycosyltransferase